MNIYKKFLIALVIIIFSYILWRLIVKRNYIMNNIGKESFFPFSSVDGPRSELNGLNDPTISINMSSISTKYQNLPLIECCIKSSYNSAFTGKYINNEMLLYLLSRGCRYFDFEVYYIKNENNDLYTPQVAYSTDGKFITIESSNTILLDNVFTALISNAFSSQKSPNNNDPLFINLRIKSNNNDVYDAVAKSIDYSLKSILYRNLVTKNTLIKVLMGYVVLSIDKTINYNYKNYTNCKKESKDCYDLSSYTNIESGSENMNLNRYSNILSQNTINLQILNDNLKTNISQETKTINLVLPDYMPENAPNPDIKQFIMGYGCQIVPFKFYQLDSGLRNYEVLFNDNKAGIIPLSNAIKYYKKLEEQNT